MAGVLATGVLMLLLLASGVWVAVALGSAGFVGLVMKLGVDRVISFFGKIAWEQNTNFVLIAVPLFIFMGEILYRAGIMERIYTNAAKLVSFLPGGLLQTNIAACTMFAACSGSSVASAATIGSVGYPLIVPRGYDRPMALGSIAAGGTLGILIPPSIIFIIYGSLAEVSIGKLFLAGVFPGVMLATFYGLYIAARALINPDVAPKEKPESFGEMVGAFLRLWQVLLLAVVILGGIYGGVASPTEVAGLGAFLSLIFAISSRKLNWEVIKVAGLSSIRQTAMILFIIMTAKLLSLVLIYYQLPNTLVDWINGVGASALSVILLVCAIYLFMGMFFDGVSMMVITIPFVVPIMQVLNVDLIWLGVLICLMIEIGLLTPPVGLNLYVLQGATNEPLRDIITGSLPFILFQFLAVAIVLSFPALAVWLPNTMF